MSAHMCVARAFQYFAEVVKEQQSLEMHGPGAQVRFSSSSSSCIRAAALVPLVVLTEAFFRHQGGSGDSSRLHALRTLQARQGEGQRQQVRASHNPIWSHLSLSLAPAISSLPSLLHATNISHRSRTTVSITPAWSIYYFSTAIYYKLAGLVPPMLMG